MVCARSSVRGVGGLVGRDHRFVALAHREQLVLAHDVLTALLHVVLVNAGEHDGIHRTGFLAEAAVDALEEIDVVARGAPGAIGCDIRVDGDAHRRADRLAQFAGDAALLAVRVAAQRVQAAKARRLRSLLLRVVERVLARPEGAPGHAHALEQLGQEEGLEWIPGHARFFSGTRVAPTGPRATSPAASRRRSTPASPGSAPSIPGA